MAITKSTGNRAQKSVAKGIASTPAPLIQEQLRVITVELRYALSAITVGAHALYGQNAEIDADVALMLQRGAAALLFSGLERIEALLKELDGKGSAGCVH